MSTEENKAITRRWLEGCYNEGEFVAKVVAPQSRGGAKPVVMRKLTFRDQFPNWRKPACPDAQASGLQALS